jgi:hypothetical protein
MIKAAAVRRNLKHYRFADENRHSPGMCNNLYGLHGLI